MGRKRSRMTILKRQRELRKAEKAARKRARRHGVQQGESVEPRPTVESLELLGLKRSETDEAAKEDAKQLVDAE